MSIRRKEKEKKVLLVDGVSIEMPTSTWLNFTENLSLSPQALATPLNFKSRHH